MPLTLEERLTFITEAGKILGSSLQFQSTLQRLAELVSSTIADICIIDLFQDDGAREQVAIALPNEPVDVESLLPEAVMVPLPIDGGTLGVMSLVRIGQPMASEDLIVVHDLARLAALSVENSRLYQRAQAALLTVRNQAADIRHMNEDLERRVVERTVQLEAANREMSVVNYTVSHDLRAPLRAIQGYSQMLAEDFAQDLPEGAKGFIAKINNSTKDVAKLLDGLLNFCKFSSHPLTRHSAPLNEIVAEAVETLQTKMQGRKVDLRIGELAEGFVDPVLVKQVFVNLLSNALTYTSIRDVAVIEIGQFEDDGTGETVVFVRDNGVGFDPADETRLFEAFRRLHTDAGYEGTGVGLTIVAGIVQRHGGRIWATGIPGEGASFYFTLGKSEPDRIAS